MTTTPDEDTQPMPTRPDESAVLRKRAPRQGRAKLFHVVHDPDNLVPDTVEIRDELGEWTGGPVEIPDQGVWVIVDDVLQFTAADRVKHGVPIPVLDFRYTDVGAGGTQLEGKLRLVTPYHRA